MIRIKIHPSCRESGQQAAEDGAVLIKEAIRDNGHASIILATGASQFDMLDHLVEQTIDWTSVTLFHLDEYIGISPAHPASFCRYLKERFVNRLPCPLAAFHSLDSESDPELLRQEVGNILAGHEIDVAFVGIGENGHLAFNDPPADFDTVEPFLIVQLDEACRRQQFGEGWFKTLEDVPTTAISMSVRQIMKSRSIICTVPDKRKARAVQQAFEGEVSVDVPASILQEHPDCRVYLDSNAASMLKSNDHE